MPFHFLDFFTHPLLRAPTWGTFFLCIAFSLMGVFLILQKRSLLSETLSHATWPGILLILWLQSKVFPMMESNLLFSILLGGSLSAWLGFAVIDWMEKKKKIASDAALCFVLASFFGIGTMIASALQFLIPRAYQEAQTILFGQAAALDDHHLFLYGALALTIALFIFFNFPKIQLFLFDKEFAKSFGIKTVWLERVILFFLLCSLLLGVESIGVLLIAGMSIAPAVAARQLTERLGPFFILSALFGGLSGLLGNFLSVWGSYYSSDALHKVSFPTGPMIILVATFFALTSLLFSPKKGLVFRKIRALSFRLKCLEENLVKAFWKKEKISMQKISSLHQVPKIWLQWILWRLKSSGWIQEDQEGYFLTKDGKRKAASIVRLHRLWELYLTSQLRVGEEKVHRSAEEMEHIITPDLETRLTHLLKDPEKDPHNQKIPKKGAFYE